MNAGLGLVNKLSLYICIPRKNKVMPSFGMTKMCKHSGEQRFLVEEGTTRNRIFCYNQPKVGLATHIRETSKKSGGWMEEDIKGGDA